MLRDETGEYTLESGGRGATDATLDGRAREETGDESLLVARNITQHYKGGAGGEPVLDDVSLTLNRGEIVALLGRSGCGKSTLLRIVSGLIRPSAGEVRFRGRTLDGPPAGIAMVFQSFALFPWLTVLENVEMGMKAARVPAMEARRRALAAIDMTGLDGFEAAYPKEISGGMRQRVGFARGIVTHPDVLLMDEPFSALDVLTAETLRSDLVDLWSEGRLPIEAILMVTHNIEEAVLMSDRILVLSSHPGRISSEIRVRLPHPRNRLDPEFRQSVDDIYALMTRRTGSGKPGREGHFSGAGIGIALPRVSTNSISGMIEEVAAPPYDGHADLPHLADSLQLAVDELFPIAESLQLLRLAEIEGADIRLTASGARFAEAGVDERKAMFGELVSTYVPIVGLIRRVLDERPSHHASATRFREQLEDHMSSAFADRALLTAINWGRYGELFSFDEKEQVFRARA